MTRRCRPLLVSALVLTACSARLEVTDSSESSEETAGSAGASGAPDESDEGGAGSEPFVVQCMGGSVGFAGTRATAPENEQAGSAGEPAAEVAGAPGETTSPGESDSSLVGTWVGYFESYQLPSGSDALRVIITEETPSGYVVFGQGEPPPPATDPDVGYPPLATEPTMPYEGFEYTIKDGSVDGARVRFSVIPTELWEKWCSLQTSYETSEDSYDCLPKISGYSQAIGSAGAVCAYEDAMTGDDVCVDCGKLSHCHLDRVCECSASGCAFAKDFRLHFDLDHVENEMDGSYDGGGFSFGASDSSVRVRLTRQ